MGKPNYRHLSPVELSIGSVAGTKGLAREEGWKTLQELAKAHQEWLEHVNRKTKLFPDRTHFSITESPEAGVIRVEGRYTTSMAPATSRIIHGHARGVEDHGRGIRDRREVLLGQARALFPQAKDKVRLPAAAFDPKSYLVSWVGRKIRYGSLEIHEPTPEFHQALLEWRSRQLMPSQKAAIKRERRRRRNETRSL